MQPPSPLQAFRDSLKSPDILADLRAGLIGEGMMIPGTQGEVPLVYADYVASGRALRQVEDFIATRVLPFYANSHTEDSYCGHYITRLREEARAQIARLTHAEQGCAVIFTGAGATAGLNRLVPLLGVDTARAPVVFIGPYEHHSNILPWRESRAEVVEIPESPTGGPDLAALAVALRAHAGSDLVIGSFSAASNVTGALTDTAEVTRLLKAHGARAVWDYAAGAPYLPIDMASGTDAQKDAVVLSAHKFPGGPGASGVLILRENAVTRTTPTAPGGGTVCYVSPWRQDYTPDLAAREEAGTPNIPGDIRAALVFLIKEAIGQQTITAREAALNRMALAGWRDNPHIQLLGTGTHSGPRLPIFSFLLRDRRGRVLGHTRFARLLSDRYGIQTRAGCACAGPYGHRLLHMDRAASEAIRDQILAGNEAAKPGWVRLNFSYLMSDETAHYIIDGVNALARQIGATAAA